MHQGQGYFYSISELSGFLILSRLMKVVVNAMDIKPSQITLAVNSQCTISALDKATIEEVKMESIWRRGPAYLTLPREHWPFSRQFRDTMLE